MEEGCSRPPPPERRAKNSNPLLGQEVLRMWEQEAERGLGEGEGELHRARNCSGCERAKEGRGGDSPIRRRAGGRN